MFGKNKKTNMEAEIVAQTQVIPSMLDKYINFDNGEVNIDLPPVVKRVIVVASGSSYHCARLTVDLIERLAKIETRAIYSSEFLIKSVIPHEENTLYIFITQSGETSDTVKCLERVKKETNLPTLCITNVEDSTIWKECDYKVACMAGEELGIAATKSLTSQMLCSVLIALKLADGNDETIKGYKESLKELPSAIEKAIAKRDDIKKFVKHFVKANIIMVTAEGSSYAIAKEATLKIKETSYKNITAAILGEFMHGHVAVLNNKGMFIYFSAEKISERAVNNINLIKKDYNPTIVLIGKSDERVKPDYYLSVDCGDFIPCLFANVVMAQIIA
ncbi:MAG: SIS domain-containing protein, partial [bacterium]|nr:SIS domain-containing protein [bacterium]